MPELPILLAGVGLAGLSCVLQVVSVATPWWLSTGEVTVAVYAGLNSSTDTSLNASIETSLNASIESSLNASISVGLWKICFNGQGADTCNSLNIVTDAMQAVRAMSILAFLLLGASAGVGVLMAFRPNLQVPLILLAPTISFAGEIAAVICIAIFVTEKGEMYTEVPVFQALGIEFRFSDSVFLSIAAAVMALFSTLVYVLARSRIRYTQLGP